MLCIYILIMISRKINLVVLNSCAKSISEIKKGIDYYVSIDHVTNLNGSKSNQDVPCLS